MKEKFNEIILRAENDLKLLTSTKNLNDFKAKYVGKNGEVTALLRGMKDIPAEERAEFGKMVNELKNTITELFDKKEEELKALELQNKFNDQAIDITLPGKDLSRGSLHPLNIVKNKILKVLKLILITIVSKR